MKNQIVRIVLSAVLGLGVFAGSVQAAEGLKIGSVSVQQALNEVEQGKNAKAALKSEFDQKQKKLNIQQEELKKMQEDVEKQRSVLSQDALLNKQKVFSEKLAELQKNMAGYRDELMAKEGKMTGQILQNLKKIVGEIGQKEGFTLIVETSQESVLYAKAGEDLTKRVIAEYNKRFTGPLKME